MTYFLLQPELRVFDDGHTAACHYAEEIEAGRIRSRTLGEPEIAG